MIPFAVAPDGGRLFAAQFDRAWSGVVQATAPNGKVTKIRRFDRPSDQAGPGDFDGRWLVWIDDHSRTSRSDWELRAWNARANTLRTVARVPYREGNPIPGPFVLPVVDHGLLAWTQSTPTGSSELHVYDLKRSADRVMSARHPGAPSFAWPWLIWTESDQAGVPGTLRIHSFETSQRVAVPEALKDVRPGFFGGAPEQLAWIDADVLSGTSAPGSRQIPGAGQAYEYRTLRYWRAGWRSPIVLARMPEGDYAQFPTIADGLVAWTGSRAQYVADLRSGSYTQVTPQYGGSQARGRALMISYNSTPAEKTAHPILRISVARTNELPPLPGCS